MKKFPESVLKDEETGTFSNAAGLLESDRNNPNDEIAGDLGRGDELGGSEG